MIFIPKNAQNKHFDIKRLGKTSAWHLFYFTFSSIHILDDFILHPSRGRTKCLPFSDFEVVTGVRGELCHTAHCHFFVCVCVCLLDTAHTWLLM